MVQLCRESKMALTCWMPCCDNENWLWLFIDTGCSFPLRINAKEVRRICIKVSVELWCTQALSCPAYLNLSFFLAYRISITDISLQIHVLTLKNKNKPCFSSFLNLFSCFHILSLPVHNVWHLFQFKCQRNYYPDICLFWIINEDKLVASLVPY